MEQMSTAKRDHRTSLQRMMVGGYGRSFAHVTMPYRHSGLRVLCGIAAARGDFNRFADRMARADTARLSDAELLASLRANIHHPWRPPRGGQAGALSHDVIHGLDITEALGLPRVSADRARQVLDNAGPRALAFFGTDLAGLRLVATDTDLSLGAGPEVVEAAARRRSAPPRHRQTHPQRAQRTGAEPLISALPQGALHGGHRAGEAGVGKTTLLEAFREHCPGLRWLSESAADCLISAGTTSIGVSCSRRSLRSSMARTRGTGVGR